MAQTIRDVMTPEPHTVQAGTKLADAAAIMRDADIGDVIVMTDGTVSGIVTDRDMAVRAVAEGRDPKKTAVGEICSKELVALSPADSVEDAIGKMREMAIRRLPVVDDGRAVGIVSLGDLAVARDPDSVLADISAASPNL
jgi:CBS domain-containing protein